MNELPAARPEAGRPTRLLERQRQFVFEPRIRQAQPHVFEIVGSVDDERVVPWGFWGGVGALIAGALLVGYYGVAGLWEFWNVLIALVIGVGGLLLLRFGRRSSLEERRLAEVDLAQRTLRWVDDENPQAQPVLPLEEITEIVFGMTRYPVSRGKKSVKVHAFSLLVRHGQDLLIPLIEGSSDKAEVYGVARFIGRITNLDITQVGEGIK